MNRRSLMFGAAASAAIAAIWSARGGRHSIAARAEAFEIVKTDAEWRAILTPDEYAVLREEATERAFTSPLNDEKRTGNFTCAGCDLALYPSSTKFDSGTGWPSFSEPVEDNVVAYHRDGTHGMERIEATCNVCDAHLGHVFPDGPHPSGLRFCINALSLGKVEQDG